MNYNARFSGIQRLYGRQLADAMRTTKVMVVGLGGVGSWVVEALVRSGFEHLVIVDLDDICVSNTNRQVHTTVNTVGQFKAEALAERAKLINPDAHIEVCNDFVTPANMDTFLAKTPDFIVDAIDGVKAKTALIAAAKKAKVALVSIGGAGGKTDPTRIQVSDLSKTEQDPLTAKVRSKLRKEHDFPRSPKRKFGVDVVWSNEPLRYPAGDGEVCFSKPSGDAPRRLDCATGFGAATMVTATFGFIAVSRIIERLAQQLKE
ncbi:tRNA cyclic N6-threonylcarbamoyladenosine(37) synthase TcdA [Salinibius halmophilus]|uniref:tRNA cyclic N6-threonylcarbamoyladenosine(37) synthase TcdA n=1 Tax=Salinibius halmophilus TaxID=1853216 RepID=UPI000E66B888|nr:tRNA cyclic N6-threonylcarbamoyladenosine(37) synthase TcdA [Salinibius halmophilus]